MFDYVIQRMVHNSQETEKILTVEDLKKFRDRIDNLTIDEVMGKEKPPEDDCVIFIIDGGIGDVICSTPMIRNAKSFFKDKKIVVRAFYPEVFFGSPYVDHLYSTNNVNNMFESYVRNLKNFHSIIKRDLYNLPTYSLFPGKVSEAYCYTYGIPYTDDDIRVYISDEENFEALKFSESFEREIILIQPEASRVVYDPTNQLTSNKDWYREQWEEVVKELQFSYDVVQVGGKGEKEIKGVSANLSGVTNFRQTMALAKNSLTFISVDSFMNHVGPAVGVPGVVLFGRSNPYIFGHEVNRNLWVDGSCPNLFCGRPQGYFGDNEIHKAQVRAWTCPNKTCMKAITSRMVLDNVYDLIRNKKGKEQNTISIGETQNEKEETLSE